MEERASRRRTSAAHASPSSTSRGRFDEVIMRALETGRILKADRYGSSLDLEDTEGKK